MKQHRWRESLPGLSVCQVCELEEDRRGRRGLPPMYDRRPGTGLPPPPAPELGPGPCPGPVVTEPIIVPRRIARGLVSGALTVARMPTRTDPPRAGGVAQVGEVPGGPPVGEVRVGSVRHELLGWILWPTYDHPDDPRLAGYEDPEAYIAELAEAWGVTPDAAAITWVWRIQTEPYREEVRDV